LSRKELRSFLRDLKAKENPEKTHKISKNQIEVLIKELDTNSDNKIDLYEF
jgi:Ca2+-binding EF-hand superfamily protein